MDSLVKSSLYLEHINYSINDCHISNTVLQSVRHLVSQLCPGGAPFQGAQTQPTFLGPVPLSSPSWPPFLSSPFPLYKEVAVKSTNRRSGERCELPQWSLGQSPGRRSISVV